MDITEIQKQIAPLPYTARGNEIDSAKQFCISQICHSGLTRDRKEATAAYLTHVANNYPKLLALLQETYEELRSYGPGDNDDETEKFLKQASEVKI